MKDIDHLLQQLASQKTPPLPKTFEINVWQKINHQSQPSIWQTWLSSWRLSPSLAAFALFLTTATSLLTHLEFKPENKAEAALDLASFSSHPENLPSTLLTP